MNLTKQEREHKEFLKLQKEYNELLRKKWSIEPIKLDKPIHHGFIRFLRIRPEYYNHVDYETIKKAFDLIGVRSVYSKTSDFRYIDKRKKKVLGEKHAHFSYFVDPRFKYYMVESKRAIDIARVTECKNYIKRIDVPFKCNCNFFNGNRKDFLPHYEFSKPWVVEEKTDKHWLTHYTPIDSDIETRMAEINSIMNRKHGWAKICGRYKDDYHLQIFTLKEKVHGYLHGWPKPRIDDLYEW